jgi:hypothetical protein
MMAVTARHQQERDGGDERMMADSIRDRSYDAGDWYGWLTNGLHQPPVGGETVDNWDGVDSTPAR